VFSTPVLWYNADLFEAAGLDPDAPPATWEQALAYALAIQEATDAVGINVSAFGTFDWMFQSLVLSSGGRVLSEDRTQLTFDSDEALGAVEMLRGLHDAGVKPDLSFNEAIEAFVAGRMGMYVQTSAVQSFMINASTGVFDLRSGRMPAFGDRPTQPVNSGSALVILTDDPVKQRAAWELMRFATSDRGYTIITSDIGYLPLRPSIIDDPEFLGPWVEANPIVRPNLAQLEDLSPWVPFPGPSYRQMVTIMMNGLEEAVFGGGDAREAMLDAHERASALMPR
jgi:multiple sugar transport system substrate-binding protein